MSPIGARTFQEALAASESARRFAETERNECRHVIRFLVRAHSADCECKGCALLYDQKVKK